MQRVKTLPTKRECKLQLFCLRSSHLSLLVMKWCSGCSRTFSQHQTWQHYIFLTDSSGLLFDRSGILKLGPLPDKWPSQSLSWCLGVELGQRWTLTRTSAVQNGSRLDSRLGDVSAVSTINISYQISPVRTISPPSQPRPQKCDKMLLGSLSHSMITGFLIF